MPNRKLPTCPSKMPDALCKKVRKLGANWATTDYWRRIPEATATEWDKLIEEWAEDPKTKLFVRSQAGGKGLIRTIDQRNFINADNSPAQWIFRQAFQQKKVMSLKAIRGLIKEKKLPSHMVADARGKNIYCVKLAMDQGINDDGWRLCHIVPVSSGKRTQYKRLDEIKGHFLRLMKPSNMFLIPNGWGGLGEIEEFRKGLLGL